MEPTSWTKTDSDNINEVSKPRWGTELPDPNIARGRLEKLNPLTAR